MTDVDATAAQHLIGTALASTTPTRPRRLGAWTVAALRDIAYAGAVFLWSVVGFSIVVTGISLTATLLVLVIGVVVWLSFVHVLRWTTWVDRRLAGWQRGAPVAAVYRRAAGRGPVSSVRARSGDPQTWKDLAWVALNSFVGFAYGVMVITAAALVVAYVSMPVWYWAVSHPQGEHGVTDLGVFNVDTLEEAAVTSAIGLVLLPVMLLLARAGATLHSRLAVHLLAPVSSALPHGERGRDA